MLFRHRWDCPSLGPCLTSPGFSCHGNGREGGGIGEGGRGWLRVGRGAWPEQSSTAQTAPLSAASTPPFPTQTAHPALNVRREQLSGMRSAGIGDSLHICGSIVEAQMIPLTNAKLPMET